MGIYEEFGLGVIKAKSIPLKWIEDLKRLQKEIDEAEEEKTTLTVHSWGGMNQFEKNRFNLCDETVTKNQLKIKQIIESL